MKSFIRLLLANRAINPTLSLARLTFAASSRWKLILPEHREIYRCLALSFVRSLASFQISGPSGGTKSTSDAEGPGSSAIKVARASPSSHPRRRHRQPDIHMQQPEEISSLVNKKSSYRPGTLAPVSLSCSLSFSLSLSTARSLFERFAREVSMRVASEISDDLLRVALFFAPIRDATLPSYERP